MHTFMEGMIGDTSPIQARKLFVARTQLLHLALDAGEIDSDRLLFATTISPPHNLKTVDNSKEYFRNNTKPLAT